MRFNLHTVSAKSRSGIALIMVLMVITVLGVIAFGFAKSMSVETKLARNATFDTETEWLGRSGVEYARYIRSMHRQVPNEGNYDDRNQYWAGGWTATNESYNAIVTPLTFQLGAGEVSIKIVDLEDKFNINLADDATLRTALEIIGVDATQTGEIVDSILDWRDTDDTTLLNGAESDYYLSLSPPYMPKNGPIDDLEELLRIKGVTPEIYYGPNGPGGTNALMLPSNVPIGPPGSKRPEEMVSVGLKDLFTTISAGVMNNNSSSISSMQVLGLSATDAQAIKDYAAGPDKMPGTDDDFPFKSAGDLRNVPGLDPNIVSRIQSRFPSQSATFEVTVTVKLNNKSREMVAILRQNSITDVKVLRQYWK
jgi:general secretion pathway protein K